MDITNNFPQKMMVISNILSIFAEIFDESLESESLYG